ncbi:MAG: glutamate ligase domain-containing protein, partial [Polaribacter sp.]
VIIGEEQATVKQVFLNKARETNSEIIFASDNKNTYKTDLLGDYQQKNMTTAVVVIQKLKVFDVSEKQISKGLLNVVKNTHLKGRWQVLQKKPKVICDTAHNKEGLVLVLQQLKKEKYTNLHIVLGVVSDKNLEDVLPIFPPKASYYFCKPNIPRGLSEAVLQEKAAEFCLYGKKYASVENAFQDALLKANQEDIIYVGGSTFVVAEII